MLRYEKKQYDTTRNNDGPDVRTGVPFFRRDMRQCWSCCDSRWLIHRWTIGRDCYRIWCSLPLAFSCESRVRLPRIGWVTRWCRCLRGEERCRIYLRGDSGPVRGVIQFRVRSIGDSKVSWIIHGSVLAFLPVIADVKVESRPLSLFSSEKLRGTML
jgi:hypothetical protein